MSNSNVDVIATFNTSGEVKPLFVRIEDESHMLHTCKIEKINQIKEEKVSGINYIQFYCMYEIDNMECEIILRYYIPSHKWCMINFLKSS